MEAAHDFRDPASPGRRTARAYQDGRDAEPPAKLLDPVLARLEKLRLFGGQGHLLEFHVRLEDDHAARPVREAPERPSNLLVLALLPVEHMIDRQDPGRPPEIRCVRRRVLLGLHRLAYRSVHELELREAHEARADVLDVKDVLGLEVVGFAISGVLVDDLLRFLVRKDGHLVR